MKIFKIIFIVFFTILITTSIKTFFFAEWTFTDRLSYNIFWALHYSSFVLSFFSFLLIYLKEITPKVFCSTIAIVITYFIFHLQFNPIDTNKYPIDKKVLSKSGNEKIVVREKNKGKSNAIVNDTIKVNDIMIFRKIIKD